MTLDWFDYDLTSRLRFFSIDFWAKTAVAQEHPEVRYSNKLYAEMLFVDDSD